MDTIKYRFLKQKWCLVSMDPKRPSFTDGYQRTVPPTPPPHSVLQECHGQLHADLTDKLLWTNAGPDGAIFFYIIGSCNFRGEKVMRCVQFY